VSFSLSPLLESVPKSLFCLVASSRFFPSFFHIFEGPGESLILWSEIRGARSTMVQSGG